MWFQRYEVKILITQSNPGEAAELKEYFQSNACEVFIAQERKLVYQVLAKHSIDAVLYNVVDLYDFAVIRYINKTYPQVNVVVTSDAGFCANIDNIRQGAFTSLRFPYHLNQLQELITTESVKSAQNPSITTENSYK